MTYHSHDEIFGQYESLARTMDLMLSQASGVRRFFAGDDYEDVVFVACGSSYWLSLSAHMTFVEKTGKRAFAVKAGEVVMNPEYYAKAFRRPLLVVPSRSGATSEVLMAVDLLRRAYGGARMLCAVVYPDSELEKAADLALRLPWCNETSVCQTRSFSNLYLAMVLMGAAAGGDSGLPAGLRRYVEAAPALFAEMERRIAAAVREFSQCDSLVVIGTGKQYGVAVEAAYIGIEMAAFPANYYSTLELRHGPIVRLDGKALLAVIANAESRAYQERMAADARRKGAKVLAVVDRGGFEGADWVFGMGGQYPPEATALYGVAVMQGFACFKAIELGLDPDRPPELVPFIRI